LLLAGILVRRRLRREPAVGNIPGRPRRRLIAENATELRRGRTCGKAYCGKAYCGKAYCTKACTDHEHDGDDAEHETLRSWAALGSGAAAGPPG
jgi:hypothetical protein